MIESLIVTLREGIEIALVVGITLIYLKKIGQPQWAKPVWWGFFWAVLASFVGAFWLDRLPIEEEAYEGILYLVAATFVSSMMIWMARTAKNLKKNIHAKVDQVVKAQDQTSWRRSLALGVFTFLMVFREGAELVLFLAALSLRTAAWANFVGAVMGLALAVLFGASLVKGTLKIDLQRFFQVTGLILGILVVQLVVSGLHELEEAGWISPGPGIVSILDTLAKNQFFLFLALALIPILFLWNLKRVDHSATKS